MFIRVVFAASALFAALAAVPANAQVCQKAGVSFACRSGATGNVMLDCRRGESQQQCCTRLRRRANDPRRGFCTGRDRGVARLACRCAGGSGGDRAERVELMPVERIAPREEGGEPAGEAGRGERRLRAIEVAGEGRGGAGARNCRKVGYAFSCRREGGASGNADCRRGGNERACCARLAVRARQTCQRKGGVARFRCACAPQQGGRGGNSSNPATSGITEDER